MIRKFLISSSIVLSGALGALNAAISQEYKFEVPSKKSNKNNNIKFNPWIPAAALAGFSLQFVPGLQISYADDKGKVYDYAKEESIELVKVEEEKQWKCKGCSAEEQYVLSFIQKNTLIDDKNALATLMGNIKQESMFLSNICEGGARVPYNQCHSGGFGLIQWTTHARYDGLGYFCNKYSCDPSTLEGQVRYMINENQFQSNLAYFEGSGQSINYYMNAAYRWLGWGIHGNRTSYAYDYLNRMTWC
jgi:hypothetical protein